MPAISFGFPGILDLLYDPDPVILSDSLLTIAIPIDSQE